MNQGFTSIKLRRDLTDAIDNAVENAKDDLGLAKYKSRADFVSQASKKELEKLMNEVTDK